MKKFKKILAALTAMTVMAISFTSCGDTEETVENTDAPAKSVEEVKEEKDVAEETKAKEEEPAAEKVSEEASDDELGEAVQELANALDGTLWIGMDSDFDCVVAAFEGTEIYVAAGDVEAEGFWAISEDTLYIYEDEAMTNEVTSFAWDYEMDEDLLVIADAYLTQSSLDDADQLADEMVKLSTAAQTAKFLEETYWVAIEDDYAEAIYLSGSTIEFINISAEGEETDGVYNWGLDYDTLNIYGDGVNASFEWNMAEDGSEFTLVDTDGKKVVYTQCSEEDAVDIMAYLTANLTAAE